jgi:hypothetical protein
MTVLSPVRPKGFPLVVAEARLSQGKATAPRSLFLAYNDDPTHPEFVVAIWNHDHGAFGDSDYILGEARVALPTAYNYFIDRLQRDYVFYTSKGVPLTGFPQ